MYPVWTAARLAWLMKRTHWFFQTWGGQIWPHCGSCACSCSLVRLPWSAALGQWWTRARLTVGWSCSAKCPMGWASRRHRSCCKAPPSVARTARATGGRPTASPRLRTSTGSSSAPRTVWWGHRQNKWSWLCVLKKDQSCPNSPGPLARLGLVSTVPVPVARIVSFALYKLLVLQFDWLRWCEHLDCSCFPMMGGVLGDFLSFILRNNNLAVLEIGFGSTYTLFGKTSWPRLNTHPLTMLIMQVKVASPVCLSHARLIVQQISFFCKQAGQQAHCARLFLMLQWDRVVCDYSWRLK